MRARIDGKVKGVKMEEESFRKDVGGVVVKSNGGERPGDKKEWTVALERCTAPRPVRGV